MNDLELYIYIALVLIYFVSRALKRKKAPKPTDKYTAPASRNQETSRTETRERPLTFEELLEEFTGYKEVPQTVHREEVQEFEEETAMEPEYREPSTSNDEYKHYEGYDDYKKGDYTNYDELYKKSQDLTAPDEPLGLDKPLQRMPEAAERFDVPSSRAKKIREMLLSKNSLKDAIILKELLDPKYL